MTKMQPSERIDELERKVTELERLVEEMRKSPPLPGTYTWPFEPKPWAEIVNNCPKCGLQLNTVMGYCCPQPYCPTGLGGSMC